ncbi:contractile injection system protein, VgrG/Pvc8 family [Histophilus somni]|uniref:contractile injection system protein, VgrG/Pvc8 family n=1 Tax=Histophilus somni TaxID=731 RepID=UPI00201E9069|nr:contractile injection system protein, VgrG/Pvc8 family [Histophilus somni]
MKPTYTLHIEGNRLDLQNRLIQLQIIDKDGMESDELSIELDDSDGQIQIPPKGKKIEIAFGFNQQTQYLGKFIVDETGHQGPPDKVIIKASSADFRQSLLKEREESYDNTTLEDILNQLATRNQLEPAIHPSFKDKVIEHQDQTNESDANLLTRLAHEYDAIGSIKDGKLLFLPRAKGESASGKALPTLHIHRNQGDQHSFTDADRDEKVSGVIAYYQDKATGTREMVVAGEEENARSLKQTYSSEEEAQEAAEAEMKRTKVRARKLTLNLAQGRPDILAGMPLKVEGFKAEIADVNWFAHEVTHSLNDSGYLTHIQCEEMHKS